MTLDTTPSGPASNSYASVADADAYHGQRGFNTEWTSATQPAKETALQWATMLLDQMGWKGGVATMTQLLRWPRVGVYDRDNRPLAGNVVPRFLVQACAEWALQLIKEDWTQGGGSMVATEASALGPIKTPAKRHRRVPPSVLAIIQPYLTGGTVERV